MRLAATCIAACAALLVGCAGTSGTSSGGGGDYLSTVGMEGANDNKLTGRVGDHMSSRIVYTIGWHTSDSTGHARMRRAAVTDPEYIIFGESLPQGLNFNPATGTLSGTPQQSGVWRITPAVRDRVNGENPYRGRGFWWTTYRTYQGKTWIQAEKDIVIEIRR